MKLSLGIVGLPNVGKSTLFNALTKKQAPAENYPFCTIDPNVGIVPVADKRLEQIAAICKPKEVIPAVVEFYDIAGLVKGANKGEGLGNQFLTNIRETSAIVHVVRAFQSKDIIHVENSVDSKRDLEIINTELILKDISTVEKRVDSIQRQVKSDKKLQAAADHLAGLLEHLNSGKLANEYSQSTSDEAIAARQELFLLTDKPVLYVLNVEQEQAEAAVADLRSVIGDKQILPLDIKLEHELVMMDDAERAEFMEMYGLEYTGLEKLTQEAYKLLGLASYFTAGPEEARAWTFELGMTAPQAAGVIHTDFIKGFVAAEVMDWQDYVANNGWEGAKSVGKLRLEGRDYIMREGDLVLFRINK
jgi:GTP-binding protein YchF